MHDIRHSDGRRSADEAAVIARRDFANELSQNPATERGDLDAVARVITESCCALLGLGQVGVWLFDETETELRCFDQFNALSRVHTSGHLLREHEFAPEFRALKTSLYVDASDPLTDPRTAGYVESYVKPQRISSMLDLVIRFGGRNLGTLCFEHIDSPHRWKQDEIDFGLLVCAQLSILLERRALKSTEESRRAMQERLAATLHSISEGVVGTDTAGRVTDINAVAEGLTGWTLADARGQRIDEVVRLLDVESGRPITCAPQGDVPCALSRSLAREIILTAKDGTQRRVTYDVAPIRLDDQRVIGTVVVVRDVAEDVRIREELVHARKMESVGVLAGGVAHDLNNILSPIVLVADVLLKDPTLPSALRPNVETIHAAGSRAGEVTRQLLTFASKQPMAFRRVDLNRIVVDFSGILRRTIREDIAFEMLLSPAPAFVHGDRGQLEQALLNLVLNAQDAMPRGGRLVIETRRVDEAEPESGSTGRVVLTVRDTGHGMDPATLERIFDPFFTTKRGSGTGLGLSSVYGIVRQHRGEIEVDSRVDEGTTFRISFPSVDLAELSEPTESPTPTKHGRVGTERILLVDDERFVCGVVGETLRGEGYDVMQATTPSAAIEMAGAHAGTIDLLLTDVVMPGINGKELHARLLGSRPGLKVLYMSAYQHEVIARQGVLESGVLLLHKPFSRDELLQKVREALDR